jgi:hypothetical protein
MICSDIFGPEHIPGWETASEKIGKKDIPFYALTKDHAHIKRGKGISYISASKVSLDSADDLFLGFSGGNHAYLVFRGQRLDGGIAVNPITAQLLKIKHHSDLLESGIFLRFKNIPTHLKDSLEAYLTERSWGVSLTCIRGVCDALENSAGLRPINQRTNGLLPTHTLSRLINKGLVDKDGHIYTPEIYVIGGGSLKEYIKTGFLSDHANVVAGTAIVFTPLMILHSLGVSPF